MRGATMNSKARVVKCFCGSDAHLQSNSVIYGREYGNGKAYICDRWPECDGAVGTHPDGKPLGELTNGETRKLRRKLHSIVDPLWQNQNRTKRKARGSVYGWLQRITGLSPKECHIAMFDAETCVKVLGLIARNPYKYDEPLNTKFKEFEGRPKF